MNPIEKVSMTDQVVNVLLQHIKENDYQIGDKLPSENELCKQLQVGRSTIREALRIIQARGYIQIIHGRGAYISSIASDNLSPVNWIANNTYKLKDIYSIRRAIEVLAVRMAATKRSDKELLELTQIHAGIVSCCESKPISSVEQVQKLAMLDEAFHTKICESSHNPLIASIMKPIAESLRTYRLNSFSIIENQEHVVEPHQKILDAIRLCHPEAACVAMEKHLDISLEDISNTRVTTQNHIV